MALYLIKVILLFACIWSAHQAGVLYAQDEPDESVKFSAYVRTAVSIITGFSTLLIDPLC